MLTSNRVQQRAMGSGQPYFKSGTISWLKHTLLHGRLPVWAFLLTTGLLLLRMVSRKYALGLWPLCHAIIWVGQ